MAVINSPLFQEAGRQIKRQVRLEFARSDYGRLMSEAARAVQQAGQASDMQRQVNRAMGFMRGAANPSRTIRELMGAELGGMVRAIERYARGNNVQAELVRDFLRSIGPAGHLIESLMSPTKKAKLLEELQAAMQLVRAFGGETLPGPTWTTPEGLQRGLAAAQQILEEYGFTVAGSSGPLRHVPEPEWGRKALDVEMGVGSPAKRVPADHPLLTGEMVSTSASTNVYEFGYDIEHLYLYVRFQATKQGGLRGGAGALYRYAGVTPDEFMRLWRVRDQGDGEGGDGTPGTWVWTHLRQRGTVSGHKKDYELVGIMPQWIKGFGEVQNYVPRKASVRATYRTTGLRTGKPLKHPVKTGMEEWYETRTVRTHKSRMVQSVLPTARTVGPRF